MPVDTLLANKAFDAETTHLLGSAFDAAWEEVKISNGRLTDERHAASNRELLAKCIIEMVDQGERNPYRLIENALSRMAHSNIANAKLPTA